MSNVNVFEFKINDKVIIYLNRSIISGYIKSINKYGLLLQTSYGKKRFVNLEDMNCINYIDDFINNSINKALEKGSEVINIFSLDIEDISRISILAKEKGLKVSIEYYDYNTYMNIYKEE
ncbi:hypothetical protein [Terrisporobacter sp.]|uniref:hypothetical protein n=1 Tax=Terrisporobacter sp. TaxID=1965305 RepID=UPI00262A9C2C|nr:hypothetical protein [Terrisporobacter sp.]